MIANSLARITNWLTTHAPRITEFSLNGPATDEEIATLKGVVDKEVPEDLINLYKTYNGMNGEENIGNFVFGIPFLSIGEIVADQEFRANQSKGIEPIPLTHFDPEIDGTNFYNLNWIAISFDGSRSYLRIDLSPSSTGHYGQIIFVDGDYQVAFVVARSVEALMNNFADDLEKGLYTLNEEALEDEQHFLEPAVEIDIINWHNIEKWKKYA